MSIALSVQQICERALRKMGAFAIRSSGARAAEMEEARYWLDMVVGHQTTRKRTWWLVPATGTIPLVAGVASYDLTTLLGAAQAPNGVEFVVGVYLVDTDTDEVVQEISLRRRTEWEQIEERGRPGEPAEAYIDRHQRPTLLVSPVPDGRRSLAVRILFQSYSADFTSTRAVDRTTLGLRSAWNLWVVTALAYELGNGPVRKLPADEVRELHDRANELRADLEAYDDHEQANEPRRVAFTNF